MSLPTYVEVPVGEIGPGPAVRSERVDLDHVARLRLVIDFLPSIKIRQTPKGWALVDGQHRLSAHKFEERETIRCEVVELDDAQALEAAIAANIEHGLYLSITERKAVARRMVELTDWSSVRIAAACGLHRSTVDDLRPAVQHAETDRLDKTAKREGADGKDRPATKADAKASRAAVAAHLTANPGLTLRQTADACGVAPMTVASVRNEMKAAKNDPPAGHQDAGKPSPHHGEAPGDQEAPAGGSPLALAPAPSPKGASAGEVVTGYPVPGDWKKDPAIQSNAALDFAMILDRRLPRSNEPAAAVAAGCPGPLIAGATEAADEAIAWWTTFRTRLNHPTMEAVK